MEEREVVVVGAGIAGLAAAWELRGRDVVVLEATARPGGRIRSYERGHTWLNLGAHVFGGPGTAIGRLLEETGVESVDIPGTLTAVSYRGRLVAGGPIELYPLRLPFSTAARLEFLRVGLRLRRLVARYGKVARPVPGEEPVDRQQRMLDFMDDRSFAEEIGSLSPEVDAFFRCTLTRGTGEPEEISAGYGVGYFHLVWNRDEGLGRGIVGGPQRLMDALAAPLGERLRFETRVTRIRRDGDAVVVSFEAPTGPESIRARSVITALSAHAVADLAEGLPTDLEQALRAIVYGPTTAAAFLTDETGPQRWDDVYAIATPERSTSMLFNITNVVRGRLPQRPAGSSFMVYAPASLGRAVAGLPDDEVLDLFQSDLEQVLPELRGHVVERMIHRVVPGIPFPFVGRGRLQPILLQPTERIHVAGDYLGSWYGETSAWTGRRAAQRALAEIA
jgi:oxygen-dependent protoporphyrinogen oxidase